jgi:hypothetical protein
MVMARGLDMGKDINGLCLHGYMIYAQFGLGRAGRSASGEWRSTAQWWMRKVQGMQGRLKRIGHCPRGDLGSVDIGSFWADERWGEYQRATHRRRRRGAVGGPGRAVV